MGTDLVFDLPTATMVDVAPPPDLVGFSPRVPRLDARYAAPLREMLGWRLAPGDSLAPERLRDGAETLRACVWRASMRDSLPTPGTLTDLTRLLQAMGGADATLRVV